MQAAHVTGPWLLAVTLALALPPTLAAGFGGLKLPHEWMYEDVLIEREGAIIPVHTDHITPSQRKNLDALHPLVTDEHLRFRAKTSEEKRIAYSQFIYVANRKVDERRMENDQTIWQYVTSRKTVGGLTIATFLAILFGTVSSFAVCLDLVEVIVVFNQRLKRD